MTFINALSTFLKYAADSEAEKENYFNCRLIITKPQPNLHSGDTSIQRGTTLGPENVP